MNELGFRAWLLKKEMKPKVVSDVVCRLKRIEREIKNCDIDEQYHSDKCKYLFKLFEKQGQNEEMAKYPDANFPIGKRHIATYRLALKHYVDFANELNAKR